MRKHAAANDAIKPTSPVATALAREATKQWQQCLKIGEKYGLAQRPGVACSRRPARSA